MKMNKRIWQQRSLAFLSIVLGAVASVTPRGSRVRDFMEKVHESKWKPNFPVQSFQSNTNMILFQAPEMQLRSSVLKTNMNVLNDTVFRPEVKLCTFTGFSVFGTNYFERKPIERVLDTFGDFVGRILLEQYPLGKINIAAEVISSDTGCINPKCATISFTPGWSRYNFLTATKNEFAPPFRLYPTTERNEGHYEGYLELKALAYHTSDCSGTPNLTMVQQVQTVAKSKIAYDFKETIAVYTGTNSSQVTARATASIVNITCNFIRDALVHDFLYKYHFDSNDASIKLAAFDCLIGSLIRQSGPQRISYRIIPTFAMSPNVTANGFGNRNFPTTSEIWTAIIAYFKNSPVRTSNGGDRRMYEHTKQEIAAINPYKSFTEIKPTVAPFSQAIPTKRFVATYNNTSGMRIPATNTEKFVTATCDFIKNAFTEYWTTDSIVVSNVDCRSDSSSIVGGLQVLSYIVVPTLKVGPTLSEFDYYPLTYLEKEDMEIFIESLFKDQTPIFNPANSTNEVVMSTFVKSRISSSNPYFNYTKISVKV